MRARLANTIRCQLTLLALITAPSAASAQSGGADDTSARDALAHKHFQVGTHYFEEGEYERAAEEFAEAYELSGRTGLLYNMYVAHERLGKLPEAIENLQAYLNAHPDVAKRAALEARLDNMRKRLQARRAEEQKRAEREARLLSKASQPTPDAPRDDTASPLRKKWWLWTAVAVVAVGATAGAVAATQGGGTREDEPFMGNGMGLEGP